MVLVPAALLVLYFFHPEKAWFYPPCLFYRFSGLYCPGCGSLRAIHNLLNGNLAKAFSYNALLVAFLPLLVLNGAIVMLGKRGLVKASPPFNSAKVVILIGFIMIVFWVLRNLSTYPFNLLAPG